MAVTQGYRFDITFPKTFCNETDNFDCGVEINL